MRIYGTDEPQQKPNYLLVFQYQERFERPTCPGSWKDVLGFFGASFCHYGVSTVKLLKKFLIFHTVFFLNFYSYIRVTIKMKKTLGDL